MPSVAVEDSTAGQCVLAQCVLAHAICVGGTRSVSVSVRSVCDCRYISRAELLALGEAAQLPPMDLGPQPRGAVSGSQGGQRGHDREALDSDTRQASVEVRAPPPPPQQQQGEARTAHLSPGAVDIGRELLNRQQQQQQQQQQQPLLLQRGLAVWEQALSPHQPLGRLVRSRPVAAIVEGGGCRLLVVHAGAFPWMAEKAVDLVRRAAAMATGVSAAESAVGAGAGVREGDGEGRRQEGSSRRGEGGPDGEEVQQHERGEWGLSGEEVVRVWNAAVWELLRECEGWECGDRGHEEQDWQQQREQGPNAGSAGGEPVVGTGNSSSGSTISSSRGLPGEAAARVGPLRGMLRRELRQLGGEAGVGVCLQWNLNGKVVWRIRGSRGQHAPSVDTRGALTMQGHAQRSGVLRSRWYRLDTCF